MVNHVYSCYTGEMVDFMEYYIIYGEIVASVSKSPVQNQPSKNVDLFDRFIMLCVVCLAYLMLYSIIF